MTTYSNDNRAARYRWWSCAVAIALAVLLAFMWLLGYGPFRANCCAADVAAAPVEAAAMKPNPAPVPLPMPAATAQPDVCAGTTTKAEVSFKTGSITLSEQGRAALDGMVACLSKNGASVVGHTDNVGTLANNQLLSERRAKAVTAYLESKGVPADKLSAKGMGDTQPIASNASAEGRASNRRMDIQVNLAK
jgi:outer membrane protein OmpA-like peptidoglycan-associated protein